MILEHRISNVLFYCKPRASGDDPSGEAAEEDFRE